jgi:uncharacterized protein YbjQ (UPF0145 family)
MHCVTTASAIAGWEIEEHLGIVASHAVAGTGLVSEFFAGFSDIFGGRSNSYRRQLESLYRDTLVDLLGQARARGANWLIGVRVDLDEVSGKGTQMFMITGLATAVRAQRLPQSAESTGRTDQIVDASEVTTMATRIALLQRLQDDASFIADAEWAFLVEHRVDEACGAVLRRLAARYETPDEGLASFRRKAAALFSAVPSATAIEVLYNGVGQTSLALAALDMISDCSLCSYSHVAAALRADDAETRRCALQTLKASPPVYSAASLAEVATLRSLIPGAFPNRGRPVEKKGVLGGTKQMWQCPCGRANPLDDPYCAGCLRDSQGLRSGDLSPPKALVLLQTTSAALEAVFATRRQAIV